MNLKNEYLTVCFNANQSGFNVFPDKKTIFRNL